MTDPKPSKVSDILSAIADGDANASPELLPLLYNELRVLARALMKKLPPGQTLRLPMQATSRSLNLSNAAAVIVFEAWRQCGFESGV